MPGRVVVHVAAPGKKDEMEYSSGANIYRNETQTLGGQRGLQRWQNYAL